MDRPGGSERHGLGDSSRCRRIGKPRHLVFEHGDARGLGPSQGFSLGTIGSIGRGGVHQNPESHAARTVGGGQGAEMRREAGGCGVEGGKVGAGEDQHHGLCVALVEEFVGFALEADEAEVGNLHRNGPLEQAEPVEVLGLGGAGGVEEDGGLVASGGHRGHGLPDGARGRS